MKNKKNSPTIFFFRFWWTILLMLFCYGFYLHGMLQKKKQFSELKDKVTFLENELALKVEQQEDLYAQVESQSDPAWVELLIKKHLGMAGFGQTKVYFENK